MLCPDFLLFSDFNPNHSVLLNLTKLWPCDKAPVSVSLSCRFMRRWQSTYFSCVGRWTFLLVRMQIDATAEKTCWNTSSDTLSLSHHHVRRLESVHIQVMWKWYDTDCESKWLNCILVSGLSTSTAPALILTFKGRYVRPVLKSLQSFTKVFDKMGIKSSFDVMMSLFWTAELSTDVSMLTS